MLQIASRHLGPPRRISAAGAEIPHRALVAEPLHLGGQLTVVRNEAIKVFLADVERGSCIARMEENLTIVEVAGADKRKNSFDFFGRQMAQKVAFRQQLYPLLRILLLASQSIFAKSCGVAYRCPLLVEEQRGKIINDRTESEAAGNESPCRIGVEALLMQFLGAFECQFDGQRTDESAGGKGQNAS